MRSTIDSSSLNVVLNGMSALSVFRTLKTLLTVWIATVYTFSFQVCNVVPPVAGKLFALPA